MVLSPEIMDIEEMDARSRVNRSDFDTVAVLGRGGYGRVSLVRKKDTGELFAMKVIRI